MAHPKRKTSKSRKNKRRTHLAVQGVTLTECSNCGEMHERHRVCKSCGYYRGRQIINVN